MNIVYAALSLGGLGLVFGILLGFAAKKFEVKVDPKIPKLRKSLPGANCGGCGYPGCDAYAEAVILEGAKGSLCTVGGIEIAEKVANILEIEVSLEERKTAFIKCSGDCSSAKRNFYYEGVTNCEEAAALETKGGKACSYGCLGLASCVGICEFDAITVENGVAKINKEKCTSCGACINKCPKNLIELVQVDKKIRVGCSSENRGKEVRESCKVGCIGCALCKKVCLNSAIEVENSLARIEYDKCISCGACVKKCPTKAIKFNL
ncbi:MAG: RnfABCDGE type electron transport complex subunit B [Clostridium sp.]